MTRTRRSLDLLAGFLLAVLVLWGDVTKAQVPPPQSEQQAAQGEQAPPVSEPELQDLVETLRDDARREELIRQLEALLAAQPSEEAAPLPEDIVGDLLGEVSERTEVVRAVAQSVAEAMDGVPELLTWLETRLRDPMTRQVWLRVNLHVALVLGTGAIALAVTSLALRGLRARLAPRGPVSMLRRLGRSFLWLLCELLPVIVFTIAAHAALSLIGAQSFSRLVVLPLLNAVVIVRTGVAAIKVLLAPKMPMLRLLPMSDATAAYLARWTRRLLAVSVYGYFALLAGRRLGLPWELHGLLLHLLYLGVAAMAIMVVLHLRERVAWAIASLAEEPHGPGLRRLPWESLASVWHVLAVLYVICIYLVWALRVPGGFSVLLEATVGSALIVVAGWLGWRALDQIFTRRPAAADEGDGLVSGLERRLSRYWPFVAALVRVLLLLAVGLALLEVWGFGALSWLFSRSGNFVVGQVLTAFVIIMVVIGVWELVSFLIERSITEQDEEGDLKLSNRTRTLLTIVRNVVLVFLSLIALFLILSELGLNIAPLLAGVGVIGLAIGFGSQKLVQDIITGMFMLMGDTVRVGDVVEVAGRTGVVEAVTIRTMQLRDYGGNVHTIPYSAIDTVTNFTKEFSYALFEIRVAYRENVDEVMDVLRALGEEMNQDPQFRRLILEPLEIAGIDRFAESAVIIEARFKTRPLKQWDVSREFLRRVKNRFDQLGIEIPYPHHTLYFGVDKRGEAPPARVDVTRSTATSEPEAAEPEEQPAKPALAQRRGG